MRHRVKIAVPAHLWIGADSWVGEGVEIDNRGPVTIGSNVVLSQSARLVSSTGRQAIEIEDGAWIALRAVVSGPVTVGRGAVVGAGAVADSDVPAGEVVVSLRVVKATAP